MNNKGRYIFYSATVQCCHCGRYFVSKMAHRCDTGFRKHKHKWIELKQPTI